MKIKKLDFRIAWVDLLDQRFDWLVDGELLRDLVGATNNYGVPLWLTQQPYPGFPEWSNKAGRMMYSVCGCGEWGCGADSFKTDADANAIAFFDFEGCRETVRAETRIWFANSNFEAVASSIRDAGAKFQQLTDDYKLAARQGAAAIQQLYLTKFRGLLESNDEFQKSELKALITKLLEPTSWESKPVSGADSQLMSDGQVRPELKQILDQL